MKRRTFIETHRADRLTDNLILQSDHAEIEKHDAEFEG